jgi:hypothetical protein
MYRRVLTRRQNNSWHFSIERFPQEKWQILTAPITIYLGPLFASHVFPRFTNTFSWSATLSLRHSKLAQAIDASFCPRPTVQLVTRVLA